MIISIVVAECNGNCLLYCKRGRRIIAFHLRINSRFDRGIYKFILLLGLRISAQSIIYIEYRLEVITKVFIHVKPNTICCICRYKFRKL